MNISILVFSQMKEFVTTYFLLLTLLNVLPESLFYNVDKTIDFLKIITFKYSLDNSNNNS